MVKLTQTIRRHGGKLFEYVWLFCGLALKGLTVDVMVLSAPRKSFASTY